MQKKRVVIVGAPGAGKSLILDKILSKHDVLVQDDIEVNGWAAGPLADFRTELIIAVDRMTNNLVTIDKDVLAIHSLIDSLAYASTRVYQIVNSGVANEEESFAWNLTMHEIALLLRTSFHADSVLFLAGNDGEAHSQVIEDAIVSILNEYKIEHTSLTGDVLQDAETIATILEQHETSEVT
jgi:hypothetical protein